MIVYQGKYCTGFCEEKVASEKLVRMVMEAYLDCKTAVGTIEDC